MDDLAHAAGVSRRTIFNHVPGKVDAVLGPPNVDVARLAEFRSGGPTGDLAADIKVTVCGLLDSKSESAEELARLHQLMSSDERLRHALIDRLTRMAAVLAAAIAERDPDGFPLVQAHAAARAVFSLLDVALDAAMADPAKSLSAHFVEAFDTTVRLFSSSPVSSQKAIT